MFKRFSLLMSIFALMIWSASAMAHEGMWLLSQLNDMDWQTLQKEGMQLTPQQVQNMQKAVVLIDGGTGEMISPEGLLITNHHVGFGAIQYASNVEHNYIENGFYAPNRADEIPIPTYDVRIPEATTDVTKDVLKVVKDGMTPLERYNAIQKQMNKIEKKAEKDQFTDASVVSMYDGLQYMLFVYKKYKDVRLVYAPPLSIGDYGGDIDNWMWPRQVGDFSIFRVYTDKKGNPADYSKDNVPLSPSAYLTVSKGDLKAGDFVFTMGYPGTTYRYRSSWSLQYNQDTGYPNRIELYQTALDVLNAQSAKSPEDAIKLSGFVKGLNNALKNNQGMLADFNRFHIVNQKKAYEKKLMKFVDSNPDLKAKYGNLLDDIGAEYASLNGTAIRDTWLGSLRFARMPNAVYTAYRYAMEKEKPASKRDPEYTEKNMQRTIERLKEGDSQFVPTADRDLFKAFLYRMADLPAGQHVQFVDEIVGQKTGDAARQAIDTYIDNLYKNTQYKSVADIVPLFNDNLKTIKNLDDPMVQLAENMAKDLIPLDTQMKTFDSNIQQLRAEYIEAMKAWKGDNIYPDANRTLRFTYGTIKSYSPQDAVLYEPFTDLTGVVEKNTGEEPFNAPQKLMELEQKKDFGSYEDPELKDVPVDFLATTDITGGNSGSPVLNGKGELIGLAFDGNYESIASDYWFLPQVTRSINVDSRYVLFILDKFSNAQNLLKEMKIDSGAGPATTLR